MDVMDSACARLLLQGAAAWGDGTARAPKSRREDLNGWMQGVMQNLKHCTAQISFALRNRNAWGIEDENQTQEDYTL